MTRTPLIRPASSTPPVRRAVGPVSWSVLGLAVSALAQWAVVVVLARYGGPAMLGQYALGLAIGAPVTLLAGLGLRTVLVTDTNGRYGFGEYLRLRAVGMSAAVLSIVAVALLAGTRHAAVVGLVAVAKALDGFGDIYLGLFQRHHRMRPISISMIVNSVVTLAAMAVLLLLTGNVVWTVLGSVLGSAVGSVAYCRHVARRTMPVSIASPVGGTGTGPAPRPSARRMGVLAVLALPVGLASGLASFGTNVPRYLVDQHLGAAALGVFAALSYVVLASNMLFGSIAQAMLPRMVDLYTAGDVPGLLTLTRRLVAGALSFGAGCAALSAILGERMLALAYGAGFARYANLLTVLAIAVGFSGVVYFVNITLLAVRRFHHQLLANSVALVLAAGVGLLLIPRHGLGGAAWATVLALVGDSLFKAVMLRRTLVGGRVAAGVPAAPPVRTAAPRARLYSGRRRR